ncbi:GNAT family N-acetyltransferase [Streptomyces zaomyceticus]|uniref:GNAT family N-acetyltransferase n=1 Tax=Streptomyces zaomyceticus TaxID=68286 RepID=UPI00386D1ECF
MTSSDGMTGSDGAGAGDGAGEGEGVGGGGADGRGGSGGAAGAGAVRIAPLLPAHAEQVLEIYRLGIEGGDATFEANPPTWEAFDSGRAPGHRLVALDEGGRVLGWAAVGPVSDRCAYAGVVEHSVYVRPDARGRGVGLTLLRSLLASTDAAGIWTVQSGIFPENTASLALHARAGFRVVGTRERLGRHRGVWRDVVLVERRSPSVD